MNREDIIRMALAAGIYHEYDSEGQWDGLTNEALVGKDWLSSKEHKLDRIVEILSPFAALVAAAERNILAAWMIQFGFATGHGDTMEQLVDALGSEIVDRIEIEIDVAVAAEREACAKVCEELHPGLATRRAAEIIRARSNT